MNPYYRIAVMVLRMLAAGFVLVSLLNLYIYWFKMHRERVALSPGHCGYLSIPLVIGSLILVKSSAWARRLTRDLDE
jgi:hypothetical protein